MAIRHLNFRLPEVRAYERAGLDLAPGTVPAALLRKLRDWLDQQTFPSAVTLKVKRVGLLESIVGAGFHEEAVPKVNVPPQLQVEFVQGKGPFGPP